MARASGFEVAFFAGEAEEVEGAGEVVVGPGASAVGQAVDEVADFADEDVAAGGGLDELEADGGRVAVDAVIEQVGVEAVVVVGLVFARGVSEVFGHFEFEALAVFDADGGEGELADEEGGEGVGGLEAGGEFGSAGVDLGGEFGGEELAGAGEAVLEGVLSGAGLAFVGAGAGGGDRG